MTRMADRIDTLGALFFAYGLFAATVCTAVALLLTGIAAIIPEVVVSISLVGMGLLTFAIGATMGGLYGSAGVGLSLRKPWARPLAIGMSCLALGDIPIGMSLGIFGLTTLLNDDARKLLPVR